MNKIYAKTYDELKDMENTKPVKISYDELDANLVTLGGFQFLQMGAALLCVKCGTPQNVVAQRSPDQEINFYLDFKCDDYTDKKVLAASNEDQHPQENPQPNPEA